MLAFVLLLLFLVQSAARLVALLFAGPKGALLVAIAHCFDLAAFYGLLMLVLIYARRWPLFRLVAALLLAVVGVVLLSFDLTMLVSLPLGQRPLTLSTTITLYCGSAGLTDCFQSFPVGSVVAVAATVSFAALIYLSAGSIGACAAAAMRGRFGWLLRLGLFGIILAAAAAWLLKSNAMLAFEPLSRFLSKNEFPAQPSQLMTVPRPDYHVVPTANIGPRPLVLIVVDSLRADAVELGAGQASGTPFLRSLAIAGKLHDAGPAVAVCATSYCGLAGLLSSSDWAAMQQGPPLMLPDVLAANGYQSHYLLSGPHRRVLNLPALYGPNVTTLLDDSSTDSSGLIDDREQVRRLSSLKLADPQRSFIFVHLMSAHAAGLRFNDMTTAPTLASRLFGAATYSGQYRDYYDRGVQQADEVIRQLFAALDRAGLMHDALVIITADHGERLGGEVGHGGEPDLDTALVPLLVYDPHKGDWPSATGIASQIDIAPTLLAAAGIRVPAQWRGTTLQSGAARVAAPSDGKSIAALVSRIDGHWTIVRCDIGTGITETSDRANRFRWSPDLNRRKDARRCHYP